LECISENPGNQLRERYRCGLCNVANSPSIMYLHIISINHRKTYLLQKNFVSQEILLSSPFKEVKAYAEKYEKENGRHINQIKVSKKSSKRKNEEIVRHVPQTKTYEFQNVKKLRSTDNTKSNDAFLEPPPGSGVSIGSLDGYNVQQLPESNCFNNLPNQFNIHIENNTNFEEHYSDDHIVEATTPNITTGIQEDPSEFSEITDCSIVSDSEDAVSVITVLSSTSSDVVSDMEEEDESDQMTNYNFNNNYDVEQGSGQEEQQVPEANWNLTKMECLQLFMEQSEPLIIESKSQWEFLVSVIQSVSESVEKCNLQNLNYSFIL